MTLLLALSLNILLLSLVIYFSNRQYKLSKTLDDTNKILDLITNGVQKSDMNGVITYSNKAHHNILGADSDRLFGSYIWDFQANKHYKKELREYFAYVLKEQPTPTPYISSNITLDGRDVILELVWDYERNEQGKVIGFISIITDITQSEQIKRTRLESESQLNEAQSIAHLGSWVLTDKLNWSDEVYKIFEVDDRDSINSFEDFKNLIHPDDKEKVQEAFTNSIKQKKDYEITHRIVTQKNRSVKYVQERCQHKYSSNGELIKSICTVQDITDYKLTKNRKQSLGRIIDESFNEIYIFEQDTLKFTYANKGAIQNSGYSLNELNRLTPIDIKPELTKQEFLELINPLSQDDVNKIFFTTIHERKDSTRYPVDIYLQSIEYEGKDSYVAIILDTTEREQNRQKLLENQKIMIAQSRHAAMGEIISMVAHQWRQPLSVIAMEANNLLIDMDLDNLNEEGIKTQSQNILKQTEYLSKTIDDFRNFFRPDKEMEEIKLEEVIYEAKKIIGRNLENNDINLTIEYNKSYIIKTYSRELLQVYINLLKNAKEALIDNRENNRNINVVISSDESNLITTVCDNGGGIESDVIDKIFNPYFSTKGKKNGTGLGLYMSKTIIEKHIQGKIEAYNLEDGACFKVLIPIK